MLMPLRCNTDVTSLLSGTSIKAVVAYISDYVTKASLKIYHIFSTVKDVLARNTVHIDGSKKTEGNTRILASGKTSFGNFLQIPGNLESARRITSITANDRKLPGLPFAEISNLVQTSGIGREAIIVHNASVFPASEPFLKHLQETRYANKIIMLSPIVPALNS